MKDLVEGRGPWLNLESDKSNKIQADLQLEKATKILYLDIGKYVSLKPWRMLNERRVMWRSSSNIPPFYCSILIVLRIV